MNWEIVMRVVVGLVFLAVAYLVARQYQEILRLKRDIQTISAYLGNFSGSLDNLSATCKYLLSLRHGHDTRKLSDFDRCIMRHYENAKNDLRGDKKTGVID